MVHVRDEIPEIPVTGVSIKGEDSHIIKVGEYISLEEEIAPEDATNQNVTWSSSDENIAKVDAYGTVTGVGVGEATITVKTEDGGKEATCAITVEGVPVEKLTLTETTLILGEGEKVNVITSKNATNNLKGEKKDLGVVITPENATNKKIK